MTQTLLFEDEPRTRKKSVASTVSDVVGARADARKFVDNFEALADAPGGPAKLRGAVLELAVRGLLVGHYALEGTGAALLDSIGPGVGASGSLGKPDAMFDIPATWVWTKIGSVCSYIQRGKSPKYVDSSAAPVVSQKCVQWEGFLIERARFIDPKTLEDYGEERLLRAGDLLWNSTGHGTVGRIAVYGPDAKYQKVVADSHVTVVRPKIDSRFLWCWVASPTVQSRIDGIVSGTTKQTELATATVVAHPMPLPPLAEQKRIVARVDQLMALIDDLEAKQTKKRDLSTRFTKASLENLITAESAKDIGSALRRVLDNLHLIAHRSADMDELRRYIIRVATNGNSNGIVSSHRTTTVDEIAHCLDSRRKPVRKDLRSSGDGKAQYPYFGANGQVGWIDSYIFDEPLVCVVEDETFVGRRKPFAYRIEGKTWVNNHAHVLRAGPGVSTDYLHLSLAFYPFDAVASGTTGRKKLTKAELLRTPLRIPSREHQELVVTWVRRLLDLCDDLEAKLRRAEDLAAKLVEAVVQEMVV